MKLTTLLQKTFTGSASRGIVQLVRYGLVVGVAAPIDLGGYILLKSVFNLHYVLAATISFTVSLLVNYWMSVAWVWTNRTGMSHCNDVIAFTAIGLVGLGITDLVIFLLTDLGHVHYIISKLVAFCIVFFWSFG